MTHGFRLIAKYWNILWGIIGGIALLVGLIVGIINILDWLEARKASNNTEYSLKEYIFGNRNYYIQAITNESGRVLAYGVTTRNKNFNPEFRILKDLYYIDKDTSIPIDLSKARSGSKVIILGKTTFDELGHDARYIFSYLGANDFHYQEEYYYGNPGDYQSYFFANNQSGPNPYVIDEGLHTYDKSDMTQYNAILDNFRENAVINTIFITAPGEGIDNRELRKYIAGPIYDQVRVIPEAMMNNFNVDTSLKLLQMLSTEVQIDSFIELFGRPVAINDSPYYGIIDSPTLNDSWDVEFKTRDKLDTLARDVHITQIINRFVSLTSIPLFIVIPGIRFEPWWQ